MPTILPPPLPPTWKGRPPRMSLEDLPIWQRYFPTIEGMVQHMYFDVGLGLPDDLPQCEDANQLIGWIRNTQKRADAIIETATRVLLIELRFNAQSNAIGRLMLYKQLLEGDNPFRKPIVPILVTNKKDSEVEALAHSLGIIYEIV